jgi:hypothetical protein
MSDKQEKRRFWMEHVSAWRDSGSNQTAYCRQHGLSKSAFYYWKKRLAPDAVTLVQIPMFGSGLRLIVDDHFRIEIDERFSPGTLNRLLQALGAR